MRARFGESIKFPICQKSFRSWESPNINKKKINICKVSIGQVHCTICLIERPSDLLQDSDTSIDSKKISSLLQHDLTTDSNRIEPCTSDDYGFDKVREMRCDERRKKVFKLVLYKKKDTDIIWSVDDMDKIYVNRIRFFTFFSSLSLMRILFIPSLDHFNLINGLIPKKNILNGDRSAACWNYHVVDCVSYYSMETLFSWYINLATIVDWLFLSADYSCRRSSGSLKSVWDRLKNSGIPVK